MKTNIKSFVSFTLAIVFMLFTVLFGVANITAALSFTDIFASGTGMESDPYIIETAAQLVNFAKSVNAGNRYSNEYIRLANDIILNDTNDWENWGTTTPANKWTPIGKNYPNCFSGTFDGGLHTVSGVYIKTASQYQGLFGYVYLGTIKNIGVTNSHITGGKTVGGVAGCVDGAIINCYNTGAVNGSDNYVGGVAGSVIGTATNCHNTGAVNGRNWVGGVMGDIAKDTATNCYNIGPVNGTDWVGGVAGCVVWSSIVTYCYNTGAVSGNATVGGIIGFIMDGTVINSYNTGAVSGTEHYYTGGVAGYLQQGAVTNCYSTGAISETDYAGGVAGYVYSSGTVTDCYYFNGTAEGGVDGEDAAGQATALTDEQMKHQTSFAGWDFDAVWGINSGEYPKLIWQTAGAGKPETLAEALLETVAFDDGFARGFIADTKINGYYIGNYDIKMYSVDGMTDVTRSNLATGYIIKLFDGDGVLSDTAAVVVTGDINGDSKITNLDYIAVRLHIMGTSSVSGAYFHAADIVKSDGGIVNVSDYIALKLYLLKLAKLN